MFATKSTSKTGWRKKRADKELRKCASDTIKWTATYVTSSKEKTRQSNPSTPTSRPKSEASMAGSGRKRWHEPNKKLTFVLKSPRLMIQSGTK